MSCSILDIPQGSEYALNSEYTRVVNVLGFWICPDYTRFWIEYFMIVFWEYYEHILDSKYARVLNILRLRMVLNKIIHNRYLTVFWICLEFWIYQRYTGLLKKRHIIRVWHGSEYSLETQYVTAWICKGCEHAKVT